MHIFECYGYTTIIINGNLLMGKIKYQFFKVLIAWQQQWWKSIKTNTIEIFPKLNLEKNDLKMKQ